MISITLKSKKEITLPPLNPIKEYKSSYGSYGQHYKTHTPANGNTVLNLLNFENLLKITQDRDQIIRQQALNAPYKVNDWVVLNKEATPEQIASYGTELQVVDIIDQYARYPRFLGWPQNNYPFIVAVAYFPGGNTNLPQRTLYCTVNFVELSTNEDQKK